jgi:hypothetical protein
MVPYMVTSAAESPATDSAFESSSSSEVVSANEVVGDDP